MLAKSFYRREIEPSHSAERVRDVGKNGEENSARNHGDDADGASDGRNCRVVAWRLVRKFVLF